MGTEKLYSPLKFFFHDPEEKERAGDDGSHGLYDERYRIHSAEALEFMDAIELAIRRDRDSMDKTSGMAEYLDGALGEKVTAMFPSIELHGDELYCVTEVTLSEPLTPEEMAELKDWWSGQLSDGWGEGFEQREIAVENCELYIVPWSSGEDFFIDTQREFDRRRGILRLTPEVAAMTEKDGDIYVVYKFDGFHGDTAFSLANYKQFASGPLTEDDTLDTIRTRHSLPPTSVITLRQDDELTAWYVDGLAYSKMHGFFSESAPELMPPPAHAPDISEDVAAAALRERLIKRLDKNLSAYFDNFQSLTERRMVDLSAEIAAYAGAHFYLTEQHNFQTSELEYLLRFKDPLSVVAGQFESDGSDDRSDSMRRVFDRQDALEEDYELMPDPAVENDLKQQLFRRLDANLSDYCESLMSVDKAELIGMANEIAACYAVRECLKTCYDYKTGEVEYLLQFQDPLSLVAESWPDLHELGGMTDIIGDILEDKGSHGHFARVIEADNPASDERARTPAYNEKQSVLARIREAARAPKKPRADKTKHDKSYPEH